MTRTAHCCCGALRVEAVADPTFVVACHCGECQRRTGSVFGVGAYFKRECVRTEGTSRIYVRDGQEGRKLRMHFCPTCGTTVFWEPDFRPDHIGVLAAVVEADLGPVRYLATLLGAGDQDVLRWFILVVARLLDRAAVLLLLAASSASR